jgi:hypothetical protein
MNDKFRPAHHLVASSNDRHVRWKDCSMTDFCPDGYVSTPHALARAAEAWFPELFSTEIASEPQPEAKPESPFDALVRAFSQPRISDVWLSTLEKIISPTVHRLRNYLHQGKLEAYYFDRDGRHGIPRDFWATPQADGVLESGIYWPFGAPSRIHEQRPNYPLFLRQSDLQKLLSEEAAEKRPLPQSKKPDLIAALRRLNHLPNRAAQLKALREEFPEYKITHAVFRELAKNLPRKSGYQSRGGS